ncbi:MAG: HlyD family efflux transporter periplasmic adaptor subunit [Polyangiaceae bacterium]|nr:HlyD family efflux transporter periplasmic adaptor subunit [Polyangiaceae bacterium]
MAKSGWKKTLMKLAALVAVLGIAGFFTYRHIKGKKSAVPEGIAWGNGRIEGKEVDVASKLALKVKEVLVDEGQIVEPGQVVVKMDTVTLESELAEATENVASAREQLAVAKAAIARSKSEIELARIEKSRSKKLMEENAGSQREFDVRSMALKSTTAGLAEETAKLEVAKQQVKVAEANVATIQSQINDATLMSPVRGRVLYRLAEPGEVLAAGGKALTLVNLDDIYMEIFLPSEQAAAIAIGTEARFTIDHEPDRVGVGFVSFVSPEAQFTPKEVETRSEREKLMFRVKIQVPRDVLRQYTEFIKTGVRGVGYVRLKDSVAWPGWLDKNVVRPSGEFTNRQALR